MTVRNRVAVVGVGYSDIERRSSRTVAALTRDALNAALADAGITAADVDGLATYPEIPVFGNAQQDGIDMVSCGLASRMLGIGPRLRWFCDAEPLIPMAFVEAVNAVAAGACNYAVVFRAMHNPDKGGGYNAFTHDVAPGKRQWTAPFGVHRGYQFYGQSYRRYMDLYGARPEHMATLIVNNRVNAALNERAYFRNQLLTPEDYVHSRLLTDAVRLLDCDLPVDGAAALVLTSAERAREHAHPAYMAGYGMYAGEPRTLGPAFDELWDCGRALSDAAWTSSGLSPRDVGSLQLYDGYSYFVYWWLEALGFCGRGEAWQFIQDGRIALAGEAPVNTFGGQLAEGRMHGIGHFAEAARQAMGTAGARQIKGGKAALVGCGPLGLGSAVFLFTPQPV
jgi:acetyl-CoA acetyltransferase